MLINTVCTNCDAVLKAPEAILGKRVRCKKCGEPFLARLVDDEDEIEATMPKTVKMNVPKVSKGKSRDDDTELIPKGKAKKSARNRDDDDEDTVVVDAVSEADDEDAPKPKKKKGKGKKGKKKQQSPTMLYVLIGVGALVLVGGAIGVYFGFIKSDDPPTNSTATGGPAGGAKPGAGGPSVAAAPTNDWVEIHDEVGRFRVKFPKQPEKETKTEPSPPFGDIETTSYRLTGIGEYFIAEFARIPEDRMGLTDDQILDGFVEEGKKKLAAQNLNLKDIQSAKHLGFPARTMSLELPNGKAPNQTVKITALIIFAKDRLISLVTTGADATSHSPRHKAFVDSLRIE